jgi:hypothetical protein
LLVREEKAKMAAIINKAGPQVCKNILSLDMRAIVPQG